MTVSRIANFWSYGQYSSDNYGKHSLAFTDTNGNEFYFSYKTLVAFRTLKGDLVCMKNYWGTTTGKHLNWIQPDKKQRVTDAEFNRLYAESFGV